jgi:menaquinone-dependent protoporphyrinogen oxidase
MATVLMLYGTSEGYTRKITDFLVEVARGQGHTVREVAVENVKSAEALAEVDGILLAASVHMGQHSKAARDFVKQQRDRLNDVSTAFLSVSMSAANANRTSVAEGYVDAFLKETGWTPTLRAVSGGALRYSQYGFVKRMIMKRIAGQEGMPTDTKRDYEFADWEQLRRFAEQFLDVLEENASALLIEAGCG